MEKKLSANESVANADLLDHDEYAMNSFEFASMGQRMLNLIIDVLIVRVAFGYVTSIAFVNIVNLFAPDFVEYMYEPDSQITLLLVGYLISAIDWLLYYTLCEKLFRGKTLGKLITGTRAIREDGTDLTLKDAFLRSASRIVPFEAFSGFGTRPWHDTWTKTKVIQSR